MDTLEYFGSLGSLAEAVACQFRWELCPIAKCCCVNFLISKTPLEPQYPKIEVAGLKPQSHNEMKIRLSLASLS